MTVISINYNHSHLSRTLCFSVTLSQMFPHLILVASLWGSQQNEGKDPRKACKVLSFHPSMPQHNCSSKLWTGGRSLGDVLGAHLMLWGEPTCLLTRDCPRKARECACQGHTLSWAAAVTPSRSFCFCPCPISMCPQYSGQGRHSKTFLIESLQHLESFQSSLAYSG